VKRLALLAACAAATLAACMDPATPDRECAGCYYSFADTFPPDTFVFHWTADRLPVRFWADPRGAMPLLVRDAIAAWEAQFLYGEFRGVIVSDSTHADVIVTWSGTVPVDTVPDSTVVAACSGATTNPELFSDSSVDVLHIGVDVDTSFGRPAVASCVRRVTTHEVGHSLGLVRHSPYVTDIMYSSAPMFQPSAEDRRTVEVLYHTRPTVVPPPRP